MIELKNVSKTYAGNNTVVDNISFTVKKGEILGFLGPNGAGKTTTMRMITGYFTPSTGDISVAGLNILKNPETVKSKIGYLPETPPLYKEMRVNKYLIYVSKLKNINKNKINEQVEYVSKLCGIQNIQNRIIANLSKGFQQRVGLAQALLNDPEILVLDEPTVGLDPKQIIEIRNLIKSLAGTRTIILSSHILPEVTMTCSRIAVINKGKIVAFDTPKGLTSKLNNTQKLILILKKTLQKYIKSIEKIDGVINVHKNTENIIIETVQNKDLRAQIIKTLVESGAEVLEFKTEDVSLEDVFLKLTTEEE